MRQVTSLPAMRLSEMLKHAVVANQPSGVWCLYKMGADINAKDTDGRTVLHLAAALLDNGAEMMFTLLQCGADVEVRDNQGDTALFLSARKGSRRGSCKELDVLIQIGGADKYVYDVLGLTILHWAVAGNDKNLARHLLVNLNFDVEKKSNGGKKALRTAVSLGRHEMIPILIEAGADVNEQDSLGQSHLHQAVAQCDYHSMYELLHGGANMFTTCEMLIGPRTLKYTLPKFVKRLWYEAHGDENAERAFEHMMRTVEDIDNYVRNGVDKLSQKKALAVMMGSHKDLGKDSILNIIDPDVIKNSILGSLELVQPGDIHQLIEEALAIYITKRLRVLGPI